MIRDRFLGLENDQDLIDLGLLELLVDKVITPLRARKIRSTAF
jgi:hypothetical protein